MHDMAESMSQRGIDGQHGYSVPSIGADASVAQGEQTGALLMKDAGP